MKPRSFHMVAQFQDEFSAVQFHMLPFVKPFEHKPRQMLPRGSRAPIAERLRQGLVTSEGKVAGLYILILGANEWTGPLHPQL